MTSEVKTIGVFGKLPAHGDFIQRNLPATFINTWDTWLQHYICGTQEQLAESWLDIYLTSPLWRFILSPGVIDENTWAGVMLPSVDRVGRYYPFSIVTKLEGNVNPLEFMQLKNGWFNEIESLALQALDGELIVDDLIMQVEKNNTSYLSDHKRSFKNNESDSYQFDMGFEEQSITTVYPLLLETMMSQVFNSYSIWQTAGSEYIHPCVFCTQGLPGIPQMPAMLNGNWQEHNWSQPYVIDVVNKMKAQA